MSTVRITDDDKMILDDLCEKLGMKKGVVLGYLLEQAVRYDMFDANWIDELTKVTFHELLLEADLDYRKGFEVAKYKATLNLTAYMIKELVKGMPFDEKMAYLKTTLGDPTNGLDLLERMAQHQMYTVNAEKRMYPPGQDGRPKIGDLAPSQLIKCPRGWHTKHNPCLACTLAKTCELVFDEMVEWLALHGTKEEQDAFLAKGQVRRLT